jgi:hypothetical protein
MEIDTQTLTTFEVAADGAVSLGFLDSGGKPGALAPCDPHLTRRYRSRHCARTLYKTAWELFVRGDLAGIEPALRRSAAAVHFRA